MNSDIIGRLNSISAAVWVIAAVLIAGLLYIIITEHLE